MEMTERFFDNDAFTTSERARQSVVFNGRVSLQRGSVRRRYLRRRKVNILPICAQELRIAGVLMVTFVSNEPC